MSRGDVSCFAYHDSISHYRHTRFVAGRTARWLIRSSARALPVKPAGSHSTVMSSIFQMSPFLFAANTNCAAA